MSELSDKVLARYSASPNQTASAIADHLGCSISYVCRVLKSRGLAPGEGPSREAKTLSFIALTKSRRLEKEIRASIDRSVKHGRTEHAVLMRQFLKEELKRRKLEARGH